MFFAVSACTSFLDVENMRSWPGAMLETLERIAPDGPRLAIEMVGLRQQIDRLELRFSELAAAFKKTDHWDDEGSLSAIDWIRFNCRMTSNAAGDRIAVGERLVDLGRSRRAMDEGEIGFAH